MVRVVLPGDWPGTREAIVRRAGTFFANAIAPSEEIHRSAVEDRSRKDQLDPTLRQGSMELAASKQQLKAAIALRKSAGDALKKSEQHYAQVLAQSRHMQEQLRLLSRQLLLAQEEERKKISRHLNDYLQACIGSR